MNIFNYIKSAAVVLISLFMSTTSLAAELRLPAKPFTYVAKDKPLAEFLTDFFSSQNMPVVVSTSITGSINGNFKTTVREMFATVIQTYGLTWYYDGVTVFVYRNSEIKNLVINISPTAYKKLRETLERLQLDDARFRSPFDDKSRVLYASGPPRYVEVVSSIASNLEESAISTGATGRIQTKVYLLKNSWAQDRVSTQDGREVRVPGIASVLRGLVGTANLSVNVPNQRISRPSLVSPLLGMQTGTRPSTELMRSQSLDATPSIGIGKAADGSAPAANSGTGEKLPAIEADTRTNAVIIRDYVERLGQYQGLIDSLDQQSAQVEIEAQIIDIESDQLESLGVDWRINSSRVDVQSSTTGNGRLQLGTSGNLNNLGQTNTNSDAEPGILATALMGNARRFLLARVSALTKSGTAKYIARPKVLTYDKMEAFLETSQTIYVRVAGNLEANLFNISVGTSMKVTPQIAMLGDKPQLSMYVRIEDGTLLPQSVDQIPIVQKSSLNTQAMISEGESLLIAGYAYEQSSAAEIGVPFLSKIPVLGRAFKKNETSGKRVERLFLITPRIRRQGDAQAEPVNTQPSNFEPSTPGSGNGSPTRTKEITTQNSKKQYEGVSRGDL